ncbi:nucleotide disphospho-sugar-binding domain-containing protein [Streptomyces sp. NPDC001709]
MNGPARVVVTAFPIVSHLYPLVPAAWALRAAGHEVRLALPPAFAPVAARTGLPVLRVGRDVDPGAAWEGFSLAADPRTATEQRAARTMAMFTLTAEAVLEDLTKLAERWADVVLFEPRAYAGPLAAALAGRPAVRLLYGVDHTYAQRDREWPLLEPLWRRWGLGTPAPLGSFTLDPCPAALQTPTPAGSRPMRYVPFNGTSVVGPPARGGRPRVCVTWGTTFGAVHGNLEPLRRILVQLAALDCETVALVAGDQRGLLGEIPAGVRVLDSVPLHTVLPGSALLVHQGGAGTTLTAAACAVPQLVVAGQGDQKVHAERVVAAGVGRLLAPDALSEAGAVVAEMLWDDRPTAAAAEVARENRLRPAPGTAMRAVAGLASRVGP